jgi:hypothetical protein
MADQAPKAGDATAAATDKKAQPQVKLDMSQLKSSYCNVANVTSTREEVVLNFGINQNWDLAQKAMDVELLHRVILSPFAAKRLNNMLTKLLQEYESRYGALT